MCPTNKWLVIVALFLLWPALIVAQTNLGFNWQWLSPLPQGNTLQGIWVKDASESYAVGRCGTILHYVQNQWKIEASPTNQDLLAVWGYGNVVVAVGHNMILQKKNQGVWKIQYNANNSIIFYSVFGKNENEIYAVGRYGSIYYYDVIADTYNEPDIWKPLFPVMNPFVGFHFYGMHLEGNDFYIVGERYADHIGIFFKFDMGDSRDAFKSDIQNKAKNWIELPAPLRAVYQKGDYVYIVGDNIITKYKENMATRGIPSTYICRDVYVADSKPDVFIVGLHYYLKFRYQPYDWYEMPVDKNGAPENFLLYYYLNNHVFGIDGVGPQHVMAVGSYGNIFLHKETADNINNSWQMMKTVAGNYETYWRSVYHYNGKVFVAGENWVPARTLLGTVAIYDNGKFERATLPPGPRLFRIHGQGNSVYATGELRYALQYNPTDNTWTKLVIPAEVSSIRDLRALWVSKPGKFYTGGDNAILCYENGQWTEMKIASDFFPPLHFETIIETAQGKLFAAGKDGELRGIIFQYNATKKIWERMEIGTLEPIITSGWCNTKTNEIFFVGYSNNLPPDTKGNSYTIRLYPDTNGIYKVDVQVIAETTSGIPFKVGTPLAISGAQSNELCVATNIGAILYRDATGKWYLDRTTLQSTSGDIAHNLLTGAFVVPSTTNTIAKVYIVGQNSFILMGVPKK